MKALVAAAVALGTLVLSSGIGAADPKSPKVDCQWFEVQGTTQKGVKGPVLDKDLAPLEKKLGSRAFSSWNTFKKLAGDTPSLQKLKAAELALKHGKASVMLDDVVGKSQVRLAVQIDNAAGKRTVNTKALVEAGDFIIWADEEPNGDAHLLAISCK